MPKPQQHPTPQAQPTPDDADGFRQHFAQGLISMKVPPQLAWYWAACLFPRRHRKPKQTGTTFTITTPEDTLQVKLQSILLVGGPYDGRRLAVSMATPRHGWYSFRTLGVSLGESGIAEYQRYNGSPDADGLFRFYYYDPDPTEQVRPCSSHPATSSAR